MHSGSHLQSLDAVASGRADESWGPFAIQPSIIRSAIPEERKREIAATLLSMRRDELAPFGFAGFTPVAEAAYL